MTTAADRFDVFVSAPMAAFRSADKYRAFRADALAVVGALEAAGLSCYYAARDVDSPDGFDEPDASAVRDLDALSASRYFLMIYPEKVVSSVLVEAGYAIAAGMKAVYFVRDVKHLPFLLRHLDRVQPVKVYEYETVDRILALVRRHGARLFEPWREPAPAAPPSTLPAPPDAPPGPPSAGGRVGPYTLVGELGEGSFGVVWLAERRTPLATTRFALKFPHAGGSAAGVVDAIRREAGIWVRAGGHPNVLPVIEAECYDGRLVIVTPYAADGPLDRWLRAHDGKAPSAADAARLAAGVLAGLAHLHAKGVVHRDLKPANVLLDGGVPRIADFGLARAVAADQTQTVGGTPAYMAPEAWAGHRSERTDVWSVGVMLYEMLAGRRPFAAGPLEELRRAVCEADPPPLPADVPARLAAAVGRGLRRDPADRFPSAADMLRELTGG